MTARIKVVSVVSWWSVMLAACVLAAGLFFGCGKKAPRVGENLLANPSFEDVTDGIPRHWKLENFRGLPDAEAVVYGVTDSLPYHGERSFFFKAGRQTARFYTLAQEVPVKGQRRVRIRGAIRTKGTGELTIQYPQAGFALTYFNDARERFESPRFADVRTQPMYGSTDGWVEIEQVFRLPLNTAYVVVHCVLGMQGEIWFDDVSFEIPTEPPWQRIDGENFTHYWLEQPYPEGSIAFQQKLFDRYAEQLGIPKTRRPNISYYFYGDSVTIHDLLGIQTESYIDARRLQIHSIHPVEDHEIAHFLTDPYGQLPRIFDEGTAFYLMDDFGGAPMRPQARELLSSGNLLTVEALLDPMVFRKFSPAISVPSAATFVGYLLEAYGSEKFLDLHRASSVFMGYEGFGQIVQNLYGKPISEIEAGWRRSLVEDRASPEKVAP